MWKHKSIVSSLHQRKVENSIKLINTLSLHALCHKSGFAGQYFREPWHNNKIDVNAKIIILPARVGVQVAPKCTPPMHIHCRRLIAIAVECPIDDGL